MKGIKEWLKNLWRDKGEATIHAYLRVYGHVVFGMAADALSLVENFCAIRGTTRGHQLYS